MSWIETTIGDLVDIKHGFAFKSKYFSDSGHYVVLTPGNCFNEGGFKSKGKKEKWYSGEVPNGYILNKGDLLVVMTDLVNSAPVLGGGFLIPEDNKYLHNQRLGLVQLKDNKNTCKLFLYYLFNTHSYRGQVRGSASGATVRHTSPDRIRACKVKIPSSVQEQKKIAYVLAAYDDLIENNRRRIALLEEATQKIYKEWFVRFRFPGHEHLKMIDGVPEGWGKRPIGSFSTKIGSGATPRGGESSYKTEGIPLIRSQNVLDYRFDAKGIAFIDEEQAAKLNNVAVHSKDVLINITGASVARCCIAPSSHVPARVNQHVMIIRPIQEEVCSEFLLCAINETRQKQHILNIAGAGGSTREALTKSTISNLQILVPSKHLMKEFRDFASDAFAQIEFLQSYNVSLESARDILLPKLMNGEIGVFNLEEVEAA